MAKQHNKTISITARLGITAFVLAIGLSAGLLPCRAAARVTGEGLAPAAIPKPTLELLRTLSRAGRTVAVSGSTAYLRLSNVLALIDVSNPASPTLLGVSEQLSGEVEDIAVSGGCAYVACGAGGMAVVNISNPANPHHVATFPPPTPAAEGAIHGVSIAGSYAYVSANSKGLHILDISTPTSPLEIGVRDETTGLAHNSAVQGNYVYVADAIYLRIVNATVDRLALFAVLGETNHVYLPLVAR